MCESNMSWVYISEAECQLHQLGTMQGLEILFSATVHKYTLSCHLREGLHNFYSLYLQMRGRPEKLKPCQPAGVSQDSISDSEGEHSEPSSDKVGPSSGDHHRQDSKEPEPGSQPTTQPPDTGTSSRSSSNHHLHQQNSQSKPATSSSLTSSTSSSTHQIVTLSQEITSSPADTLGGSTHLSAPHIHHSLPYNVEDIDRNELLSITKLNRWDYPIFDLATQAQTTILSQVSYLT